jgi:hypothetical protein
MSIAWVKISDRSHSLRTMGGNCAASGGKSEVRLEIAGVTGGMEQRALTKRAIGMAAGRRLINRAHQTR